MATKKKGEDKYVRAIRERLVAGYASQHPDAKVDVKRYNSASVRVRVIDPDFAGTSRTDRDTQIWAVLDSLPDDTLAEISLLLLLTPQETRKSMMNVEFENPTPSRL
jgi:hypothetical protein